MKRTLELTGVLPDVHVPYHDRRAFALALRVFKTLGVSRVVSLGDFGDCYGVTGHPKDPDRAFSWKQEITEIVSALKQIQTVGAKEYVLIAGNHEDRIRRYMWEKAPEMSHQISIENLFKLGDLGYKFVPYKHYYEIGKVSLTHDLGPSGRSAAQQNLDIFQDNIITGHTHRLSYIIEGNARGTKHLSTTLGWLGDAEYIDYEHRAKIKRFSALAFGLLYTDSDGIGYVVPVPIINYKCVVEGKLYVG